jgi:hypothetical protein
MALSSSLAVCWVVVASVLGAAWQPRAVASIGVLAAGAVLLQLIWLHGRSHALARRREIVRSFAGLAVLHHGSAITVDERPLLGEYASHREAAWAAARCGRWAVLVHAYDRYYVLTGERSSTVRTAVSFRSRAVADVVPALYEEAVSA